MQEREITIINKLGLHARAAAKFVKTASTFDAEVNVSNNGHTINGKSIMGVMMLAAGRGTLIRLQVNGSDEQAAMQALVELIDDRFGEDE